MSETKEPNNTVQAIWVGASALSNVLLGIVSTMVLARHLSVVELATFRQVAFVYSTLSLLFAVGLPSAYSYLLPRHSAEQHRAIIRKVTAALTLLGLALTACLFFGASAIASGLANPDLAEALRQFAPIPAMLFPSLGIDGIFASNKKTSRLAAYSTISRTLSLTLIIGPVIFLGGNHLDAIQGWIAASLLSLALALLFQNSVYKNVQALPSDVTYADIFAYSLPLVLASLWGLLTKAADHFFVSRFLGPSEYAAYSLAMIELPFVTMVTTSVSTVLFPLFSRMNHQRRPDTEVLHIWSNALQKSALIVYPLVIYFSMFAEDIMIALYTKAYAHAALYFRIGVIVNLFNVIVFAPVLLSINKGRLYARANMIIAAATWICMYVSILIYPSGWIIATIRCVLIVALVAYCTKLVARHFRTPLRQLVPWNALVRIAAVSCGAAFAAYLAAYALSIHNVWARLVLSSFLYITFLFGSELVLNCGYRRILLRKAT